VAAPQGNSGASEGERAKTLSPRLVRRHGLVLMFAGAFLAMAGQLLLPQHRCAGGGSRHAGADHACMVRNDEQMGNRLAHWFGRCRRSTGASAWQRHTLALWIKKVPTSPHPEALYASGIHYTTLQSADAGLKTRRSFTRGRKSPSNGLLPPPQCRHCWNRARCLVAHLLMIRSMRRLIRRLSSLAVGRRGRWICLDRVCSLDRSEVRTALCSMPVVP
jgi:hypothetical protein